MDKTMSRQIGYQKPKGSSDVPEKAAKKTTKKVKQDPVEAPKEPKSESEAKISLVDWLRTHSLIKMSSLCQAAEIDPGNFHRQLNVKKDIPKEIQEKLIPILKAYGFKDSL